MDWHGDTIGHVVVSDLSADECDTHIIMIEWMSSSLDLLMVLCHKATLTFLLPVHYKNYRYIHGYFVAIFPYMNGTDLVYICIRKSTE